MARNKESDKGKTSLLGNISVDKDDSRIETLGWVDHCSCQLGLCKCYVSDSDRQLIELLQRNLFRIAAEIAASSARADVKDRLDGKDMQQLEARTAALQSQQGCDGFAVCGTNVPSAMLDIARATARTLERRLVGLAKQKGFDNEWILPYVNRLSKLLFLLARQYDSAQGD